MTLQAAIDPVMALPAFSALPSLIALIPFPDCPSLLALAGWHRWGQHPGPAVDHGPADQRRRHCP
jgi:hypothetical protein